MHTVNYCVYGGRTWKETTSDGQTVYWAITKGCTHSQTPETPKVKRVDPYWSSWRMRAVPGKDGRLTSAECLLSHFEEQHVNQDVARFEESSEDVDRGGNSAVRAERAAVCEPRDEKRDERGDEAEDGSEACRVAGKDARERRRRDGRRKALAA